MPEKPVYKRILVKLSGEALMGDDPYGINQDVIERIVGEIAEVSRLGVEIAVVIGGGNIFRGVSASAAHMDRATADYMGMLATVMNALALQDAMRRQNLVSRVQSALNVEQVVEPRDVEGANLHHGRYAQRGDRDPGVEPAEAARRFEQIERVGEAQAKQRNKETEARGRSEPDSNDASNQPLHAALPAF